MYLTKDMISYLDASQDDLRQLIRDLCAIPAPSHHEDARAAFCKAWFESAGAAGVVIDEALNVICPVGVTEENDVVIFMAHTDTVFPDTISLPFHETKDKFYAPGVVDDTANLAVMMICARYFLQRGITGKVGVLFCANSCEEGLGNLKGCRALCSRYAGRIREVISFDGSSLDHVVTRAVGSHRYRITVHTQGGHSYGDFGRDNAIQVLAEIVQAIYGIEVPEKPHTYTTYNVGLVGGGTSVNTIAQDAWMLCEYRSDDRACLDEMQGSFHQIFEEVRGSGIDLDVELVGDRPCGGEVEPTSYEKLLSDCDAVLRSELGVAPVHTSGSTDANIPLSLGIPALVLTAAGGRGCHTREEELDLHTLPKGCRIAMSVMARGFETETVER